MFNVNGPPRGSNVVSDQSSYDIIFKDIIVSSTLLTTTNNNATYTVPLNYSEFDKIYKAEIIQANVKFNNSGIPTNVKNNCIILSISELNGNTSFIPSEVSTINNFFCQIPDNASALGYTNGSISLFVGPHMYESIQFYNPPLKRLSKLSVNWYDITGTLLTNLESTYFTLRIYYLQKRNSTTAFSTRLFNYAGSGTIDSLFEN